MKRLLFSILFCFSLPADSLFAEECYLKPVEDQALNHQIESSIRRGCTSILVPEGEWRFDQTLVLEGNTGPLTIAGTGRSSIFSGRNPLVTIRRSRNVSLEDLTMEGTVELEQTEDIHFSSVLFRNGGIDMPGRKCNQPNECKDFNRRIVIENNTFENSVTGIRAERLEHSRIAHNRFTGEPTTCATKTIGIDLDGSSEDLDRPLELGHSKGNHITQNSFEQEGSTGIRIKDSWGNIVRENTFVRSYRAMELHEGARHNQILQSYITYLSQQPVSAACLPSCAIYLGPGSVNNVFWNNFFEQNFELQFLESNRNRTYVIDESGQQNIFRSDFRGIR